MKGPIFTLILFSFLAVKAQVNYFAPIGSVWYYQHRYPSSSIIDYTKITTTGDTSIGGKVSSVLYIDSAKKNAAEFQDSIYLWYDSGKVYRYFNQFGKWGLQYDFNADSGDTFICYGSAFDNILDSFTVVVDSVASTVINSLNLKTQYYRISRLGTYAWDFNQKVIEGIGGTDFLFPKYELAEDLNDGLRCYFDSVIGYYNTGLIQSCDTVLTQIQKLPLPLNLKVYPAIFHQSFTIENHSDSKFLVIIFSTISKICKEVPLFSNQSISVDLSNFPPGIYIINFTNGKESLIRKIIKV